MSHKFKEGDLVKCKFRGDEWEEYPWHEMVYKVAGDKAYYTKGSGFITLDDPDVDYKLVSEEAPEDNVNNPSHYGQGNIEAIDYIEDFLTDEEYIGYLRGNIGKYMHRWRYKNGLEDLKKANWYLDRLMWKMENKK